MRRLPALLVLVLLGGLAGCGGTDDAADAGDPETRRAAAVDRATSSCREQWRRLGRDVAAGLAATEPTPSTLRARWVTIEAQIAYGATSATGEDCAARIAEEEDRIAALTGFSASLRPYDMQRRLAGYERAGAVASYARPSGREGRAAPSAREVRTALTELRRLAPRAAADQAAAWQQAAVVDLADAGARRRAVADLRVVSGESAAYRQASRAARVLQRVVAGG